MVASEGFDQPTGGDEFEMYLVVAPMVLLSNQLIGKIKRIYNVTNYPPRAKSVGVMNSLNDRDIF